MMLLSQHQAYGSGRLVFEKYNMPTRKKLLLSCSSLEKVSYASLSGLAVAGIETHVHGPFGSAARGMARKLQKIGVSPLLPPQSFFVKGTQGPLESGEGERATTWAQMLFDKAEASHPVMRR